MIESENQEQESRERIERVEQSLLHFLSWAENFATTARHRWWLSRWKVESGGLRFALPEDDTVPDPRWN